MRPAVSGSIIRGTNGDSGAADVARGADEPPGMVVTVEAVGINVGGGAGTSGSLDMTHPTASTRTADSRAMVRIGSGYFPVSTLPS